MSGSITGAFGGAAGVTDLRLGLSSAGVSLSDAFIPLIGSGSLRSPLAVTRAQTGGVLATAFRNNLWSSYGADLPRWSGSGLLVEGQRTNGTRNPRFEGATPGVIGSGGIAPTNMNIAVPAGVTVTLNGTGTEFGLPYMELRLVAAGASAATYVSVPSFDTAAAIAASPGQVWSQSAYIRLVAGNPNGAVFRLLGFFVGASNVFTGTMTPTAALQRLALDNQTAPAGTTNVRHAVQISPLANNTFDFTVRIYAPQQELASFSGTPILPPVGTPGASTRGGDFVSSALASLNIGAGGACTLLWSGMIPQSAPAGATQTILQVDDGTAANAFTLRNTAGGATIDLGRALASATATASAGSMTPGVPFRCAISIDGAGRMAASMNGGAVVAVTGGPTSGLTTLRIGADVGGAAALFGEHGRLSYLTTVLSDAALLNAAAPFPPF